jgi:hypothetical protein
LSKKTELKLCQKTALKFFRLRRQVFIFSNFALKQFRRFNSLSENCAQTLTINERQTTNSTYPQWLDFLGFTLVFHEQNFILAERTLLAFPPLRVAAKRYEL